MTAHDTLTWGGVSTSLRIFRPDRQPCRSVPGVPLVKMRAGFRVVAGTYEHHAVEPVSAQQARIFRAMALLVDPGQTVRDVATMVGFESASAFTRAFQSWTGETPSSYRERCGTTPSDRAGSLVSH